LLISVSKVHVLLRPTAARLSSRFSDRCRGLCAQCTCHSTVPAHELSPNDWERILATCCLTTSETRRSVPTISGRG